MYEAFYGFRDNPFRLTPDPDYLFLSATHQEALGHLLFGVNEGGGVVVITGEIGTGKTTLLRTLVRNLDTQSTTVAYIFNPALSALELLQSINADLGLQATSASKKELIDELNRFLLVQQAARRRVVVIVDEAQDLEPGVLEQLRLLSNLETEREKLLQIILVGQPELRDILALSELAQLDQRVTLRWHLQPLTAEDTAAYVRHRLRVATGGREPAIFTSAALRQLYRLSRGVPRVINVLCHRALLIGYTREERQIDALTVAQAARELRHPEPENPGVFPQRSSALILLLTGVVLLIVGGLSVVAAKRGWLPSLLPPAAEQQTTSLSSEESKNAEKTSVQAPVPSQSKASGPPSLHEGAPSPTPQAAAVPPVPSPSAPVSQSESLVAATTPSAVPSQEDAAAIDAFFQDLQQVEMIDSALHATSGLLQAWKVEGLQPGEWRRGVLDLGAIAQARELEYLPLNGSVTLLSLLDLPMIMELFVPERQQVRFVLLLGLSGDRCRVLLDHEREIPLRALSENWFGKGHVLWKDFEKVGSRLTVGSVGQNVKRLHALLSKVHILNGASRQLIGRETVFSRQTEAAVARFQKAKRLTPDGVVGPLTMILLYNTLPNYTHPSLGRIDSSQAEKVTTEAESPATQTKEKSANSPQEGT